MLFHLLPFRDLLQDREGNGVVPCLDKIIFSQDPQGRRQRVLVLAAPDRPNERAQKNQPDDEARQDKNNDHAHEWFTAMLGVLLMVFPDDIV